MLNKQTTKYIKPFLYAAIVPAFFWLDGFNFDQRGVAAGMCFLITSYALWFAFWIGRD